MHFSDISVPCFPHYATKDANFRGYNIPKATVVYMNLHRLHKDPKIWNEPNKFRPGRFLDGNLNLVNTEKVHPFGVGKCSSPINIQINGNLHRLHKDPKIWEEPEEFRPGRWMKTGPGEH